MGDCEQAPDHIIQQLRVISDQDTLGKLLCWPEKPVNTTRDGGRPVRYFLNNTNEPLTVKKCLSPVTTIAKEGTRRRKHCLVATSQSLNPSVLIIFGTSHTSRMNCQMWMGDGGLVDGVTRVIGSPAQPSGTPSNSKSSFDGSRNGDDEDSESDDGDIPCDNHDSSAEDDNRRPTRQTRGSASRFPAHNLGTTVAANLDHSIDPAADRDGVVVEPLQGLQGPPAPPIGDPANAPFAADQNGGMVQPLQGLQGAPAPPTGDPATAPVAVDGDYIMVRTAVHFVNEYHRVLDRIRFADCACREDFLNHAAAVFEDATNRGFVLDVSINRGRPFRIRSNHRPHWQTFCDHLEEQACWQNIPAGLGPDEVICVVEIRLWPVAL